MVFFYPLITPTAPPLRRSILRLGTTRSHQPPLPKIPAKTRWMSRGCEWKRVTDVNDSCQDDKWCTTHSGSQSKPNPDTKSMSKSSMAASERWDDENTNADAGTASIISRVTSLEARQHPLKQQLKTLSFLLVSFNRIPVMNYTDPYWTVYLFLSFQGSERSVEHPGKSACTFGTCLLSHHLRDLELLRWTSTWPCERQSDCSM